MPPNNKPRDHHFIPVFYLKQWRGPDKKIVEYTVKHRKLIAKTVSPKGTGFQTDLYAFPELPPELAQHIEDVFLKSVDNDASLSLDKHLTGNNKIWTSKKRSAWSRFIIGLIVRHPDMIAELRVAASTAWTNSDASSQAEYEKIKEPEFPATFSEYIDSLDPLVPLKFGVNAIIKAIDNEKLGSHINSMQWSVLNVAASTHRLLTSDRPVVYDRLNTPQGFITFPISPSKIFIAGNTALSLDNLRKVKPPSLVNELNRNVVSRARRFGVRARRLPTCLY